MILDAIIGLFASLFGFIAEGVAMAFVPLINLIAAGIEAVIGIFVSGFSLGRIERPTSYSPSESNRQERRQPSSSARTEGGGRKPGRLLTIRHPNPCVRDDARVWDHRDEMDRDER